MYQRKTIKIHANSDTTSIFGFTYFNVCLCNLQKVTKKMRGLSSTVDDIELQAEEEQNHVQ